MMNWLFDVLSIKNVRVSLNFILFHMQNEEDINNILSQSRHFVYFLALFFVFI